MRITQILAACCFGIVFHSASVFAALPPGALPDGYESWPSQFLPCRINDKAIVELRMYTHRGMETIARAVSVWYVNGTPFEAKYFEPVADNSSLSGYRATGFTMIIDPEGNWINFGKSESMMTNNELIYLRVLRYATFKKYGFTENDFKARWASCNKDRPGQLR